jgi:lysophospholipase L1-like esterase
MTKLGATLLAALAAAAFVYGFGVGRWEWPPFETLRALKETVTPLDQRVDVYATARRDLFQETPGEATVVMLGDSITEQGNWAELFPGIRIFNRGIGRETSAGILGRLPEVIARRPRLVLLMIGINDLQAGVAVETIESNVGEIALRLSRNGIPVAVQSTLLVSARYEGSVIVKAGEGSLNARVAALNARLAAFCERHGLPFVDLNAALGSGQGLPARYSYDGVHLTGAGYLLWRDAVAPLVARANGP